MMNLSAIIGYQLTAPLAARFDYSTLFYIAALLETVVILGAMFIDPEETRREMAKPFRNDSIELQTDSLGVCWRYRKILDCDFLP